jgi:plasmid stabilization system protein ParE
MTDRRSLTVIIQEEAEAEITLASHYYRNINPTLSLNFLREVFSKINYISVYPMAFQLRHKGYRAAFLETFPYKIVYQIVDDDTLVVSSVLHNHHGPDKLKKL